MNECQRSTKFVENFVEKGVDFVGFGEEEEGKFERRRRRCVRGDAEIFLNFVVVPLKRYVATALAVGPLFFFLREKENMQKIIKGRKIKNKK